MAIKDIRSSEHIPWDLVQVYHNDANLRAVNDVDENEEVTLVKVIQLKM